MSTLYYPFSNVEVFPGDILYSSISRSTYYVGHTVIVGSDDFIYESIPGYPSGHRLTLEQFWNRHLSNDKILLLRADKGADEAALWVTNHFKEIKTYHLGNYNINNVSKNYCTKLILQAFYHGACIKLFRFLNRFITPQGLIRSKQLKQVAKFTKH